MTLPPWSYTMLDLFATCPYKAYAKYVLKLKEPESPAMASGNRLDKAMEERINHNVGLPPDLAQYEPFAASVASQRGPCKVSTQMKMGITREFKPCGFFDKDVWGRGALDVIIVRKPKATIIDWKTGKNNENKPWSNNGLQLKIFTLLTFKNFPGVDDVTAFNMWLKDNKPGNVYTYKRADAANLWREVLPRVMAIEKAFQEQKWPLMPGPLCSYCPVKQCEFNRS